MSLNSANFILFDRDNRLLLQHRSMDAPHMPDYWAFFGGGIRLGETALQAVRREAREELNHHLHAPEFVFEQDFILETAHGHMMVFIERFDGDKSRLELNEGQNLGWFKAGETGSLKMIQHDRVVIDHVSQLIRRR